MTGISPSELGVQILQNCRNELYDIFPQLDGAFASLRYAPDMLAKTIGTDGGAIRFSPVHLIQQYAKTPAEVRRGYLHMLLHCLFLHLFSDTASPQIWGIACDMAVEQIIEREQVKGLQLSEDSIRKVTIFLYQSQLDIPADNQNVKWLYQQYHRFPPIFVSLFWLLNQFH